MVLKDLIDTLSALPADAEVVMDCGTVPTRLMSWRGKYADLTLDHRGGSSGPSVAVLLDDAQQAIGKTFEGYKGGEYEMRSDTPVWADPYGDYYCRGITGFVLSGGKVVVKTYVVPDEYR
jgi:hypothetical protein